MTTKNLRWIAQSSAACLAPVESADADHRPQQLQHKVQQLEPHHGANQTLAPAKQRLQSGETATPPWGPSDSRTKVAAAPELGGGEPEPREPRSRRAAKPALGGSPASHRRATAASHKKNQRSTLPHSLWLFALPQNLRPGKIASKQGALQRFLPASVEKRHCTRRTWCLIVFRGWQRGLLLNPFTFTFSGQSLALLTQAHQILRTELASFGKHRRPSLGHSGRGSLHEKKLNHLFPRCCQHQTQRLRSPHYRFLHPPLLPQRWTGCTSGGRPCGGSGWPRASAAAIRASISLLQSCFARHNFLKHLRML